MTHEVGSVRVTLLGTGTSTGVPVIGCQCAVCTSSDPRNQRSRCACVVEVNGLSLVIDTGPDFRMQALRENLQTVDAVLFTHHHFDHVSGLDDLRPFLFYNRTVIPCYAQPRTAQVLRRMFAYVFMDGSYPGVPRLELREIGGAFDVFGRYGQPGAVRVRPVDVFHGELPMCGFRIGRFAYLTDVSHIPDESYALLDGVDTLVLSALRHEPHRSHATFAEAIDSARRIGARQTYFIHMTHSIQHEPEDAALPEGINLGYDGLTFEVENSKSETR